MRHLPTRFALLVCLTACASGGSLMPAASASANDAAGVPASTEMRELLPEEQVQQAVSRLSFGARPGEADRVRAMGVDRWIAQQLEPEKIDDAPVEALLGHYNTLNTSTSDLVADYRELQAARRREQMRLSAAGDTASRRDARRDALRDDPALRTLAQRTQRAVADVQSAKLARAVVSERQLQEVMVDFWENHFSVFSGKGQTRLFLASYDRDVIRPNALGRFRDLLGAVAKSPAMLFYLDNWQSAADSLHPTLESPSARRFARGGRGGMLRRPVFGGAAATRPSAPRRARGLNENYARELMELHTLGVDGGYTQHDVIEVARALTGWSLDMRSGQFVFRPEMHDAGEKLVLGHRLLSGRGIEDGEEVLDIVASSPATARYITTKLVRRFVSDTVSTSSSALVDRCAGVFSRTHGAIRETLRCVVTSPEMFSRAAYRAKVKTPFEVVVSALRAVNAAPDTTPRTAQLVARLGQPIFGRQTPDGWPDRADAWMNTGAILNRINFGLAVAGGRVPGAVLAQWPPAATLRTASRETQVDGVVHALLGGDASPETRGILMRGENPLLSTLSTRDSTMMEQDAAMPAAAGPLGRAVRLDGFAEIVGLALGSPEFQRR